MKNRRNVLYSLIIVLSVVIIFAVWAQEKNGSQIDVEAKPLSISRPPNSIVRTIRQDKKGNIWMASWEGVFKYDGKLFTNVISKVSQARFFSILEDRKGNFWFAAIGSGVYYYDGKSFKRFTTDDGLASNRVGLIYEDKKGVIWFGTEAGITRYDGKSFGNLKINEASTSAQGDSVQTSIYKKPLPEASWTHNDINAVIEDKTGKFWIGTRGNAVFYDGKSFTTITKTDGTPFTNVRSIIMDDDGNVWLGGKDGLWRYDGSKFTNFTKDFVGYIYEDKKGNIWTSSEKDNKGTWILSRYDKKSLSGKNPTAVEIASKPMIFGILEDDKGNIWFGATDGVYRYDG
ncbi:MAG: histidine kinase, partial [Flavobacterium sp.]